MSVQDPGDPDGARDARRALAAARARASKRAERFTDAYVLVFSVTLISVWILSFGRQSFLGAGCAECGFPGSPALTATGWALTLAGALVLCLGAIGPVSSGRPEARWLLGTTADRSVLLRGPLLATAAFSAVTGTVAGLMIAIAAARGELDAIGLTTGAALGGALGIVGTLVLLARQVGTEAGTAGRTSAWVLTGSGLSLLALLQVTDGPAVSRSAGLVVTFGALAACIVLALLLVPGTPRRLAELDDRQLAHGREVVDAVVGSVSMMDGHLADQLIRQRQTRRRGRWRSRRGRGRGAWAFLDADVATSLRRWRSLVVHLAWIPLVLAVAQGLGHVAGVLMTAVTAAWAARSAGEGLRAWLGSPGLRRLVTASHLQVSIALGVVPVVVSAAVSLPTLLLLGAPGWAVLHVALGGLAATMRAADPADPDLGVVMTTPMGAMPVGLLRTVLHGPDLALALAVVMVIWTQPWVLGLAVAAVAWQVSNERD